MATAMGGLDLGRSITLFPSAARTPTVNAEDHSDVIGDYLHLIIDCTAVDATPQVAYPIQGKDPASGKYYTILASAAITGTGTTILKVGPSLTAAANLVANDIVPSIWRVIATHGDADSITYSCGANFG